MKLVMIVACLYFIPIILSKLLQIRIIDNLYDQKLMQFTALFACSLLYIFYLFGNLFAAFLVDCVSNPRNITIDDVKNATENLKDAQYILLGSISIIVPILVTLWNNFNKEYIEEYKYLADKHPKEFIKLKLSNAAKEFEAITKIGGIVRHIFLFVLFCIIISIAYIQYNNANSTPFPSNMVGVYMSKLLQVFAKNILFLFVVLLFVHVWLVQPVIGKIRKIDLIPLNTGETNGKK
jgi:hypothetical protein